MESDGKLIAIIGDEVNGLKCAVVASLCRNTPHIHTQPNPSRVCSELHPTTPTHLPQTAGKTPAPPPPPHAFVNLRHAIVHPNAPHASPPTHPLTTLHTSIDQNTRFHLPGISHALTRSSTKTHQPTNQPFMPNSRTRSRGSSSRGSATGQPNPVSSWWSSQVPCVCVCVCVWCVCVCVCVWWGVGSGASCIDRDGMHHTNNTEK